jgi:hypothetical protein
MTHAALLTEIPDKPPAPARRPLTYLATRGITKCALCGHNHEGKPSSRKVRSYACGNGECRKTSILQKPYEEYLGVQVLARLAHPESTPLIAAGMKPSAPTGRALAGLIGDLEEDLRELGRDLGAGRIDRLVAQEAQKVYVDRLRELRAEFAMVAALEPLAGRTSPEDLDDWWRNVSTIEQRHELLKVLVDEVRILPVIRLGFHQFDERRVEIVWAAG